ncbi:TadE/TadG family type IV pilus assembly protein [Mesorhizobium sp. WSM4884]|uniref:TadE/TadG family type IV pilus assembly protein n=1 Tax=Mesorhizobium sp. WSM4884 TaxID=3038542 RepID=UPI0024161F5C|nr:TadE/TadG family type IV pilus assembly protein [Mesorhizobium sp. WSM4884]MDG4885431.1 pilus assembly protein TadG-related protein [Mesorhizobium sp. WSM4884]
MIRRFLRDKRGNYALMTVITMIPLMGGVALAIDYTELIRERQETLNALDAAGLATAQQIVAGASDADAVTYAKQFFEANLRHVLPSNTTLTVTLPKDNTGSGTLVMQATMKYQPYFLPVAAALLGGKAGDTTINFSAKSEVKLKNTLEVALVLDNSGSMAELGHGSNQVRFDLLKGAAKQLVDQLAGQAQLMKQVTKPVEFSLVPFAASVNVGPANASAVWMDTTGLSPLDQENLDWSTLTSTNSPNQYAVKSGNNYYAKGSSWDPSQLNQVLTRFSIYKWMKRISSCTKDKNGVCTSNIVYGPVASWGGCVESRPYPYNIEDTPASTSTPATLFVPMFAPDETDNVDSYGYPANNNWHADITTSTSNTARQKYMPKYFNAGVGTKVTPAYGMNQGPNTSCSTTAITPLTDVSTTAGATAVKTAIDAMVDVGATNVPEGMAWGWRTLSSGAPFTEGRPETNKGNDKVLIVLTDGANTYYTPDSVSAQTYSGTNYRSGGNDLAGNKAIYSALGYLAYGGTQSKPLNSPYTYGRPFLGTSSSVSKTDYSNANYTKAMSEHFATLCNNAKTAGVIVMTIALDLDSSNTAEAAQMAALKTCSSDSRFRKDPTDPRKPAKLFWNSTGATLSDDFKAIGSELSNLRIVG